MSDIKSERVKAMVMDYALLVTGPAIVSELDLSLSIDLYSDIISELGVTDGQKEINKAIKFCKIF